MNHRETVISHAVKYSDYFKLAVLPLSSSKKPPMDYSWQPLQNRRMTVPEIRTCPVWENVGIVTGAISGIAVIDCDTVETANRFWNLRPTPVVVQTPKGFHFFYKHPGQPVKTCQAVGFDIRGDGGYVVAPPSVVEGKRYRFHSGADQLIPANLPLFDLRWIPETKTETVTAEMQQRIRNVEAYINAIHAISGQRGHDKTFKVVCKLHDSGMDELEAWTVLHRWNATNATPSWSDKELLHKLKSVYGKA
ncbi:bifunctional DNA primase/polymerase [Gimesia sp.]|uniref:bifunctional DNA primase/polymerase n=1 Tax=Gimesia sp. TaxID=2024833 RepID=UPI003A944915